MTTEHILEGAIIGAGFGSGDRVVIGQWDRSPIGSFCDIMWAEPDGWKTLFVARAGVGEFISAIYDFDAVIVDSSLQVGTTMKRGDVSWSRGTMEFSFGVGAPFPPRPDWVTKKLERPIARKLLGVETNGVSPTGVEETYKAGRLRRITDGWAVVAGRDLGPIGPPTPACGFGFSEPPPFASITEVTSVLEDPSGRLDALLNGLVVR